LNTVTDTRQIGKRKIISDSPVVPILITIIGVYILFSLIMPEFRTIRTLSGILNAASINGIIAIGVTMLMIAGEFDLSVASVMTMGGYIFATNILAGRSPIGALALALLIATIMGSINGLITIGTKIPSFIVTLGTRSIYRAAVWIYSGGLIIQTKVTLPINNILDGRLDIINNFFELGNFRSSTLWLIGIGLIFQFLLIRTSFGNHVFAIGGSFEAAKAQGINVKLTKLLCFSITGLLAGFAGTLLFSEFRSIFVSSAAGVELTAIAAAVVGGTLLEGGYGSIIGGLLGILLISVLRSGVVLLGLPSDNFEAIVGLTIVGAVVLNKWIKNRLLR